MLKYSIAILSLVFSLSARATEPELSKERVILHTNFGDVVLAFYPKVAPNHVAQILAMAKAGVYDGMAFYRLEKGFVLQLENYDTRKVPVTDEQLATIHKLAPEFSSLLHTRGILSMARYDDPIDSAEASFSILLGDAPHLDNQYTIFGKVVEGMDVVSAIEEVPVAEGTTEPMIDVFVQKAEVVDANNIGQIQLRGVQNIAVPSEKSKMIFEIFAAVMFFGTVATPIVKSILVKTPPKPVT